MSDRPSSARPVHLPAHDHQRPREAQDAQGQHTRLVQGVRFLRPGLARAGQRDVQVLQTGLPGGGLQDLVVLLLAGEEVEDGTVLVGREPVHSTLCCPQHAKCGLGDLPSRVSKRFCQPPRESELRKWTLVQLKPVRRPRLRVLLELVLTPALRCAGHVLIRVPPLDFIGVGESHISEDPPGPVALLVGLHHEAGHPVQEGRIPGKREPRLGDQHHHLG
mmetsp:Transcript_109542/g.251188  ORF Transcript_109542/g.251188 Transcript_109542/m.251188 type:complete len:219 (+) Transcript_109542:454-1110(+)